MKRWYVLVSLLLVFSLAGSACADSLVLDGTVTNDATVQVYAPIGGTIEKIYVTPGDIVNEDTVIASLRTNKVYASESGIVTGIFGQPGDNAETISARYGAVMYIEGESVFTVSASTSNAYNSTDTKFVHVGETVYLQGRASAARTGEGVITAVDGINYTIEVSSGSFIVGDSVDIFRDNAFSTKQRIGRGTVNRRNPIAVTGSGSIVSYAVANGEAIKRGDLLFETLDGSFDGFYMSGEKIYAGHNGTLAELNMSAGSTVQKDSVCAVIYPSSSMRVTAEVSEEDLDSLKVDDPVTIELTADEDAGTQYKGTVTMISQIATSSANSTGVTFTVYVDFEGDSHVRYGMSALVSTPDDYEEPASVDDALLEKEESEQSETDISAEGFSRGNRPGGMRKNENNESKDNAND